MVLRNLRSWMMSSRRPRDRFLTLRGTADPSAAMLRIVASASDRPAFDIGCIAYGPDRSVLDSVWSRQRKALRGALLRADESDRQSVVVHVGAVPPDVATLVVTVNAPGGGSAFARPMPVTVELISSAGPEVLCRFDLPVAAERTGVLAARLDRTTAEWTMTRLGVFQDGKTVRAMVGPARILLTAPEGDP
ncbi:TerD family protein [Micromonospora marina]|uniref:TerD family protein n=1 Tax=Micromonospora marina TaxID=307120 RepID=UPI003D704D6B